MKFFSPTFFPKLTSLTFLVMAVSLILSSCSNNKGIDPRSETELVSIEGSDTMSVLLNAWKESFSKENPGLPVSVSIQDSGAGIKALLDQRTDIAATSRDLKKEERALMHKKKLHLKRVMVALDSIAILVNNDNPVESISIGNLRRVYSGEITKWTELGGTNESSIVPLIRESGSGTYEYFTSHIMKRLDEKVIPYGENNSVMTSNEAMLAALDNDVNAIGYCGLSIAMKSKMKVLGVGLLKKTKAVKPNKDSLLKDYPLSRPLYLFYDSKAKPSVLKFVEFTTAESGQKVVESAGFVPLK